MELVTDTSIVISALIGGRKVRLTYIRASRTLRLYSPKEVIEEVRRNTGKIARIKGIEPRAVEEALQKFILPRLTLVPIHEYEQWLPRALKILAGKDEADAPFIALAMHLGVPLWTGDKELIRLSLETGEYRAVDTQGVEMLLEGREWREIEEQLKQRYMN